MFFTIKKRIREVCATHLAFHFTGTSNMHHKKCRMLNVAEITRNQAITHAIHYKSHSEDWNEKCTTALFVFRF